MSVLTQVTYAVINGNEVVVSRKVVTATIETMEMCEDGEYITAGQWCSRDGEFLSSRFVRFEK